MSHPDAPADSAAFGRLCVETVGIILQSFWIESAAFGRLCVETGDKARIAWVETVSRLRAAVC